MIHEQLGNQYFDDNQCSMATAFTQGFVPYAALNLGLLEKRFSKLSLFLLVTATAKVQTPFETYIIKYI